MDKRSLYEGKTLAEVEWWISYCSEYPALYWARLRVFADGSADAAFDESKVYGFDERKYAGYFLGEDEYMPFASMDAQDESDIGVKKSDIWPPSWDDDARTEFDISARISEQRNLTTACTRPAIARLSSCTAAAGG